MTWKDKLEIGLKHDASFRRDNLPDEQKSSEVPPVQPGDPTRSPEDPAARADAQRAVAENPPVRTNKASRTRAAKPHRRIRRDEGNTR